MEKTRKNVRGITLVALIVTIIILLILSGITIGQLTGSGLFENAKLAKEKYENAQTKEDYMLKQYENAINGGEVVSDRDIDIQQLKNQIKQELMQEMSASDGCPTGTIIAVMGNSAPEGYLKCDGTVYNISQYQNLANYFGTQFKDDDNNPKINNFGGDGTTTFAVPDLQGEFLRGTGTNSHTNQGSGANVGTHQDATRHLYIVGGSNGAIYFSADNGTQGIDSDFSARDAADSKIDGTKRTNTVARYITSRPTNTSVLYCIKY